MLIATGISGTIGRKLEKDIQSAQLVLGKEKLRDYFNATEKSITLIHLAGIVGESKVRHDLSHSKKINVDETLNLAREVIEDFGGRFVHISSSHIYGPHPFPLKETNPYNPQSNYAIQKVLAEQILMNYFGERHPQLVILRVFSVLGWDVADFTLGGAVKRILSGSKESISNTDDIRDFMTPTTIAGAICKVARAQEISGTFNLCSGVGIKVKDAAQGMCKVMKLDGYEDQFLAGNSQVPYIVGDNAKLIGTGLDLDLSWDPTNDFKSNK
jgi:dTDP-6-deoxy-L-talose 4-dehydrogenase (NAD+)